MFTEREVNTLLLALRNHQHQAPMKDDFGYTETHLNADEIDELCERINCDPYPGEDMASHLSAIWTVCFGYQEELIPFEDYEESDRETYKMYREEWDDICFHMARITEALNIKHEDT